MKINKKVTIPFLFFLTLSAPNIFAAEEPIIVKGPSNLVVNEGQQGLLSVNAEATKGENLSYQWFKTVEPVNRNSDDIQLIGDGQFIPASNIGGEKIEGATSSELLIDTTHSGVNSYYVEVTSTDTLDNQAVTKTTAATVAVHTTDIDDSELEILFVCGGNSGRSPMAELIAQDIFADRGIEATIDSVGTDIDPVDQSAEENAIILMEERGLDLSNHVAKMWTPQILEEADIILVASESHRNRLNVATLGIYADKIFMFREYVGDYGSIPDAWGLPMEEYVNTADIITDSVYKLADRVEDGDKINSIKTNKVSTPIIVNNQNKSFESFIIGASNYIKLSELAVALDGSNKEFNYTVDGYQLNITTPAEFNNIDKYTTNLNSDNLATPVARNTFVNGTNYIVNIYDINGEYYCKLRDLSKAIGFSVEWSADSNTITINTEYLSYM